MQSERAMAILKIIKWTKIIIGSIVEIYKNNTGWYKIFAI